MTLSLHPQLPTSSPGTYHVHAAPAALQWGSSCVTLAQSRMPQGTHLCPCYVPHSVIPCICRQHRPAETLTMHIHAAPATLRAAARPAGLVVGDEVSSATTPLLWSRCLQKPSSATPATSYSHKAFQSSGVVNKAHECDLERTFVPDHRGHLCEKQSKAEHD